MKKVCKKCRVFIEGQTCQLCGGNQFSENWKGKVIVFSIDSEIAKKLNFKQKGTYALKLR